MAETILATASERQIWISKYFQEYVRQSRFMPYMTNADINKGGIIFTRFEMQEEAGLVLSNPVLIHPGAYVSSGGTSEKIAIVYGTVDTGRAGGVHGNPSEQEDILTVVLPAKVFIDRVRSEMLNRVGFSDLLKPRVVTPAE